MLTTKPLLTEHSLHEARRMRVNVVLNFALHSKREWNPALALQRIRLLLQEDPSLDVVEIVNLDQLQPSPLPSLLPVEPQIVKPTLQEVYALRNAKVRQTKKERGWVPAPIKTDEYWCQQLSIRDTWSKGGYEHLVTWSAYRAYNILIYEQREIHNSPVQYGSRVHRQGTDRSYRIDVPPDASIEQCMKMAEDDIDRRIRKNPKLNFR